MDCLIGAPFRPFLPDIRSPPFTNITSTRPGFGGLLLTSPSPAPVLPVLSGSRSGGRNPWQESHIRLLASLMQDYDAIMAIAWLTAPNIPGKSTVRIISNWQTSDILIGRLHAPTSARCILANQRFASTYSFKRSLSQTQPQ
jgi:hypothetical protein